MLLYSWRDHFHDYCIVLHLFLLGFQVSHTTCVSLAAGCHGRFKTPHERVRHRIFRPSHPSGACCVSALSTPSQVPSLSIAAGGSHSQQWRCKHAPKIHCFLNLNPSSDMPNGHLAILVCNIFHSACTMTQIVFAFSQLVPRLDARQEKSPV